MEILNPTAAPQPEVERPIRKMAEHIEDAMIHLANSNLPHAVKIELDGMLSYSLKVLVETVHPEKRPPVDMPDCARFL